jgi:hypothetical protein
MATMSETISDATIINEVIAPDSPDLPPEIARFFLGLRFSDRQVARMTELADRNNLGSITEAEREEMESYRRVGNTLALLQARSRLSLKRADNGA